MTDVKDGGAATMADWRRSQPIIYRFRWWLFQRLSAIGWAICPEPERSMMRVYMDLGQEGRAKLAAESKTALSARKGTEDV